MNEELSDKRALLMGYMDGELTPEEMAEVLDALRRDASLRDEYEGLCEACNRLDRLEIDLPNEKALKQLWNSPFSRAASMISWAMICCGLLVLVCYTLYGLLILEDGDTPIRFAVTAVFIGFLVLLGLKIRDRVSTYSKDPYKDIEK